VSTQIGSIGRHDDHMAGPGWNLLLAPGADVSLDRLERLDPADLDRANQRGINAHNSNPATIRPANATIT